MAATRPTPLRRNVTATGTAQHAHIIDGTPATPPARALDITPRRFNVRGNHELGSNACTDALTSSATTSAGQIDKK